MFATLQKTLTEWNQSHLLMGFEKLSELQQQQFIQQLNSINFAEIQSLYQKRNEPLAALPSREHIEPIPVEPWHAISPESKKIGEQALAKGQVAVLLVAGGQGSRLGFEHPKGMFPIGPISGASLFQIHAEKVWKLRKNFGGAVPFLIMTSPATHDETVEFFEKNQFFGLPQGDVHFFQQASMPAVDLQTGQLLLEGPGKLFLSPNGHGGTLTALADSGLLAKLKAKGIQHIFYFQVDNPLVRVADARFMGRHIETGSEASSKVVFKTQPGERVGVLALVDQRCSIIEYSDLPQAMAEERTATGELAFRAGSPAIHAFSMPFLERVTSGTTRLAYHVAKKKVPFYDTQSQQIVTPEKENALKFELFVFDALPFAKKWLAVEVKRSDEFAPLKNATGADSAEDVKRQMSELFAGWLRSKGIETHGQTIEISPKVALDAEELKDNSDWLKR